MLPRDISELIMSFHEPSEYCELDQFVLEFKNLVAGRPRTIKAMLWLGWWDDILEAEHNRWGVGERMPQVFQGLIRRCW